MEYVALDGETPLTELPSFESMLKRTGAVSNVDPRIETARPWSPFLKEQSQRILRMFIPYWLIARVGIIDSKTLQSEFRGEIDIPMTDPNFARLAAWLADSPGIVLGALLSAASLIGSIFVRPRILFFTLASFGFFWALPMRNTTALHDFETIYYIGLPLVFFTIALLLARRLTNRDGPIVAAAVATVLLFAFSSFQMSHVGYNADLARRMKAGEQDLLAIRELAAGESVTLQTSILHFRVRWHTGYWGDYYLNSSPINYAHIPAVEGGFVVTRQRIDIDALLTPQNKHFFLYDRAGMDARYEAAYRSVTSRAPLARGDFDLYHDQNQSYYLIKEPCALKDVHARFFLHVYPIDADDLPDSRKQYGFDNLDFEFLDHGMLFDNKCLVSVVLPQYAISSINTGRFGEAWSVVHYFRPPKLFLESQQVASNEPAARSEFDLYLDSGKLYYVKEPCVNADIAARFFLHIIPENIDDLPDDRRQYGFDNLDFNLGIVFDGTCVAAIPLPQYGIVQIITGQFDAAGRIWGVGLELDSRE